MFDALMKLFRSAPPVRPRVAATRPVPLRAAPTAVQLVPQRRDDDSARRISPIALRWLATLPPRVRPNQLIARFPHVANRLAVVWTDPALAEHEFDALTLDRRGGRKGFPSEVAMELLTLREYHQVHHGGDTVTSVWDGADH